MCAANTKRTAPLGHSPAIQLAFVERAPESERNHLAHVIGGELVAMHQPLRDRVRVLGEDASGVFEERRERRGDRRQRVRRTPESCASKQVSPSLDLVSRPVPSLDETLVDGLERTYRDAISNNSRPARGLEVVALSAAGG
jgi:hypothetical protein